MWKKYIIKIITIIGSFLLGVILREGLSSRIITEKYIITNINYVYTFGIKEVITVLIFTGSVYVYFYIKYIESKTSLSEINKTFFKILYVELLIFSFTTGTYLPDILVLGNINEYLDLLLLLILMSLIIERLFSIEEYYKPEEDENREKLYKSREDLLGRLQTYLFNMNAIAITGAWGIGKTVFLNDFFYRDENAEKRYEKIYIDVSVFTENKRIIEKIERELNDIFEKHGILKIKDKLLNGLEENNFWCKSILSFFKLEVEDKSKNLENKIKELETKNKSIVLCLDNFERISDKNRIISLLAIIDERIPEGIKRIYLYDEEYMEELFFEKKDLKGFKEYFNKYIEHSFNIKDAEIDEILDGSLDLKKIIIRTINRIDFFEKELKSKANLLKSKLKTDEKVIDDLRSNQTKKEKKEKKEENSKKFDIKIQIINNFIEISLNFKKLLLVPRYLEQLKNFIGKINEENKVYELEWKIISDFFKNVSAKEIEEYSSNNIDHAIDENRIDKNIIFLRYLFFTENTGNNYDRLKVYKNEKKDKYELEIKKIENNIQGKLTKGLKLIKDRYSEGTFNQKKEKYQNFLEEGLSGENKYVINNSEELKALVLDFEGEIEKINYPLLEKITIDENGNYQDGGKEVAAIEDRKNLIKLYLRRNRNIKTLLQFILPTKKIVDYFNEYSKFEETLKEELKVESLEKIIKELKKKLDKDEKGKNKLIEKLELISEFTVDDIKASLTFAEEILKLSIEQISKEKRKVIDEEYFENNSEIYILNDTRNVSEGEMRLTYLNVIRNEKIIINSSNIDDYIKELQEDLNKGSNVKNKEKKIVLLVGFIKFKENIKQKVMVK